MQIHELNNYSGLLGDAYLAADNGSDTGKMKTTALTDPLNARIDNIIAGPAPSAAEIVDARLGADSVTYHSLGAAIRDQVTYLKSDLADLDESNYNLNKEVFNNVEYKKVNVPIKIGAVSNTGKLINWENSKRTVLFRVYDGRTYKVSCRTLDKYIGVAYYSSDTIADETTFVESWGTEGTHVDEIITVPTGKNIKAMIVSVGQYSTYGDPSISVEKFSGSKIESETTGYIKAIMTYTDRDLYIVTEQGKVFLRTRTGTNVYCFSLKGGTKYKISSIAPISSALYATSEKLLPIPQSSWDSYGEYIDFVIAENEEINTLEFTPENDCYLYTSDKNNTISDSKALYGKHSLSAIEMAEMANERLSSLSYDFEIENLNRRISNVENKNKFAWSQFDKPYFVFIQDDLNETVPSYVEVFNQKNAPICEAIIPSNISEDNKPYLDLVVANGGEILAHYNKSPTQETDDSVWIECTRDTKKAIESYGYTVRGIIRAGSTGESTEKGEKYCRLYYDYANDKMGISTQYNLPRTGIWNFDTIESLKERIDWESTTNGIHAYGFHGVSPDKSWVTPQALGEVIDYIKAKGCEIVTYSYLFDTFGSSVLEQRLLALEEQTI